MRSLPPGPGSLSSTARVLAFAALATAACSGRVEPTTSGTGKPSSPTPGSPPPAAPLPDPGLPPGGGVSTSGAPGGPSTTPVVGRPRPAGIPIAGTDQCRPPRERVWQLSPDQLANALGAAVPGLDADKVSEGLDRYAAAGAPFTSSPEILNASPLFAGELLSTVSSTAELLLTKPAQLHPCLVGEANEACVSMTIDTLGGQMFRRPVSAERRDELLGFWRAAVKEQGAPSALRLLVRRILSAPETIFRSELGTLDEKTGVLVLSPFELADEVAFTLTDAPPDAELRAAALAGSLAEPKALEQQVRRLLAVEPAREQLVEGTTGAVRHMTGLVRFFREWLDVDRIRLVQRPKLNNEEQVLRWLDNETMMFVRNVLWEDGARLQTLLSADYTFPSNTLAGHYGYPKPSDANANARITAPDGRRGLLMQGGFLTGHDSATKRGLFIRSRLFCQPIAAPPGVDQNLPGLQQEIETQEKTKLSPRQVRARHMADPNCAACHTALDPLGFPFDTFDDTGKKRDTWDGFPIDSKGQVSGTTRSDGPVSTATELALKLAQSPDVQDCFVRQLYAFVHGRTPGAEDSCYLQRLTKSFADSRGDVRELLVQMLVGEEMRTRSPIWEVK